MMTATTLDFVDELRKLDVWQLLDRLLIADNRIERRLIADEIGVRKWGLATVLDHACATANGRPQAIPLEHFLNHLNRVDGRGHDPSNVEWGSEEDAGSGVAFAAGAGR